MAEKEPEEATQKLKEKKKTNSKETFREIRKMVAKKEVGDAGENKSPIKK